MFILLSELENRLLDYGWEWLDDSMSILCLHIRGLQFELLMLKNCGYSRPV
jgi:hypothetical protein